LSDNDDPPRDQAVAYSAGLSHTSARGRVHGSDKSVVQVEGVCCRAGGCARQKRRRRGSRPEHDTRRFRPWTTGGL
jgi:hypothetical protein